MKITTLQIHNIGLIADETIALNKPLIIFYGEIRQGKTTVLNSVRWVCGGSFPSDIIRHGQKEAFIEMGFDGGCIRREWYVAKDGSTKARDVAFVRDGKPVPNPVKELKRFQNPFLLDQDHLRNMGETERKKYFTELFAVDTTKLDVEAYNADKEASNLRAAIKAYGEIDLTIHEPVDAGKLEEQLMILNYKYDTECGIVEDKIKQDNLHSLQVGKQEQRVETLNSNISELEKKLADAKAEKKEVIAWLEHNPERELLPKPVEPPEIRTIQQQLQDAGAANERHKTYLSNKKRSDKKAEDEKRLSDLETRLREIKKEKIAMLKTVSDDSGIDGLEFDENGNFTYQGTQAGMLSTSQVMRLSSALSELYPDGFGIELLDRGESLGRSIFELVDRAKAEEKTILATVVGERPATVPKEIGVFVVTTGKLN